MYKIKVKATTFMIIVKMYSTGYEVRVKVNTKSFQTKVKTLKFFKGFQRYIHFKFGHSNSKDSVGVGPPLDTKIITRLIIVRHCPLHPIQVYSNFMRGALTHIVSHL